MDSEAQVNAAPDSKSPGMDGTIFNSSKHESPLQMSAGSDWCRRLFLLTASDKDCVKRQMLDLAQYLRAKLDEPESFLADLASTLASRRSVLDWRLAATASSVQELLAALKDSDVHLNRASKTTGLAFVLTGQGAQWPTIGQQLLVHPVFASTLREADNYLRSLGAEWSLLGGI